MTTILPYYFICDAGGIGDPPDTALPGNSCLVYAISKDNLSTIGNFYKKIMQAGGNQPFCLLIEPEDSIWNNPVLFEKMIGILVALTFHYNYVKSDFNNPVILFRSAAPDPEKYIAPCRKAFCDQGYDAIDCILTGDDQVFSWPANVKKGRYLRPQPGTALLLPVYDLLTTIDSPGQGLFFGLHTLAELPELLVAISQAEERYHRENPLAYQLLQEGYGLLQQLRELRSQLGILQERLDSSESYHAPANPAIAHLTKQVKAITEFYKYEYEILPLWYKRLGHVLKVLMGKRTFRSLFDDNVKKYKV